jgi:hypothetical protein
VGKRYTEWSARFGGRLKAFLEKTPHFFGANGSHVLFGRSLIYRWAVLTPLVLAYEQKLWPHSPGLLRRIVRGNLKYLWNLGAFDAQRGKLRETFSEQGTPDIHETYIDNGHPYWGMQAFALFLIPARDPFWTAPEEALPVERGDLRVRFEGPQMMLVGTRRTGHVRWLQSRNTHRELGYRDKYTNFSYSSHFPFNILYDKEHCVWNGTLVFRNTETGVCAKRAGVVKGGLTSHGISTTWWAELDKRRFEVTSVIRVADEFEERAHTVVAPEGVTDVEVLEGSYALGLALNEQHTSESEGGGRWLRSPRSGYLVASWPGAGYTAIEETERANVNIIHPRMVVNTLRTKLVNRQTTLRSLHYASPKPLSKAEIRRRAEEMGWRLVT